MMKTSISELSLQKNKDIKNDCSFLKTQLDIDYFSLYIETPKGLSVISNLPYEVKMLYRKDNLILHDPMIRNKKNGLFMIDRDAKETAFSHRIKESFSIHNLYARSSTIGVTKFSYVLGSARENYSPYTNASDSEVINFTKNILEKYYCDISEELEEIKLSPILFSSSIRSLLFTDHQIKKPNYGELICLTLAKEGLDMQEISLATGYTINSVKSNLKNVRVKMNARKTIDAAILAIKMGWIS